MTTYDYNNRLKALTVIALTAFLFEEMPKLKNTCENRNRKYEK